MQITTENTAKTNTPPNPEDTLKEVLGAVAYMLENGQIARDARPIVNILCAVEGYNSDDMATLRQTILGHIDGHVNAAIPLEQLEPYELWESPEAKLEAAIAYLKNEEFEAPFANDCERVFGPAREEVEPGEVIEEIYLTRNQLQFLDNIMKLWRISKGVKISEQEDNMLATVREQLFM